MTFFRACSEAPELVIIELGDEQLRDSTGMHGRRVSEAGDACLGERHDDAAGVGTGSVSADEAHRPAGRRGGSCPIRDERSVRQLCDAQFTVGLRELSEDVESQRGAGPSLAPGPCRVGA